MQSSAFNMKNILCSRPGRIHPFAGRWPISIVAVIALLPMISGCAVNSSTAPLQKAPNVAQAQEWQPDSGEISAQYHILAGELAAQRGMAQVAVQHYVAALQYTSNKNLARRTTRMALFAGQPKAAYQAASVWANLAPDSLDAHRTAARLALMAGDGSALLALSRGVITTAATPADGYGLLSNIFSGRPDHADLAVKTLSQLVRGNDDSPAAWYALGLVALRYNRIDTAAMAAQHAITLAPSWDKAVLLRAATRIQLGQPARAQALVAAMSGSAVQRSEYHISLAQLLLDAGQMSAALSEFERALELSPNNSQARYGLAMLALNQGALERSAAALKHLYRNGQRTQQAAYYLGMINERRQAYAAARKWYERVSTGSHAFDAKVRAAIIQAKQGNLAAARSEISLLLERYPAMADRLYVAEGRMLFRAKRYQDALVVYDHAIERLPKDVDLLYGRSIVLEKMGQIEAALNDLRHILELKPGGTRAMNALGYMLTNHSTRYQDALDYISRALAADPGSPAILDSMGWVQYRLGHFDKALDYLRRAYEAFQNPEMAAHYGTVLWKTGQHDKARRIWRKALDTHPEHELLNETIKKLTTDNETE